jgi:carboxyl-terminal processing protease
MTLQRVANDSEERVMIRFKMRAVGLMGLALMAAMLVQFTQPIGHAALNTSEAMHSKRDFDRDLALRTFDAAWQRVRETYFDETFGGLDWDGVRDELRPQVEHASSTIELQMIIQDMLNRLGQSHFAVVPGEVVDAIEPTDEEVALDMEAEVEQRDDEAADEWGDKPHAEQREAGDAKLNHDDDDEPADDRPGHAGIDLTVTGSEVVVTRVVSGSPAEAAGVRPGWMVVAVRNRKISDFANHLPDHLDDRNRAQFIWHMVEYRLQGTPGTRIAVTFLDHNDEEMTLDLQRIAVDGEPTTLGNMPTMYASLEYEAIELGDGDGSIGLIRFNVWMLPMVRSFAEAMHALSGSDGIVIDLRGNPGGIGAMAMSIAGFFTEERFSLGTMMNRQTSLEFRAVPQFSLPNGQPFDPFTGPVAILIDGATGSTSEIFTAGMQESGRARVFGETSYGAVLPSVFYRLPNGDVLQHAIADFVSAKGTRLEGRGVVPDEPVQLTRDAMVEARDPMLEAAMTWIQATSMKREAALAE